MKWRERDGVRWLEAGLPGGRAAFSTRPGGVSEEPYEGLNLSVLTGDRAAAVRENRRRLAAALDLGPASVVIGRQVHGAELRTHRGPQRPSPYAEPGSEPPEVDGHTTAEPGVALLVFAADCLPVALAGSGGMAMVHAGWRGLAAGIVERGAAAVDASAAAVGPGIGPCCYEVGPEVLDALAHLGEGIAAGRMLDLFEVARRALAHAGVEEIEVSAMCTSCNPELLYSHRRDGPQTGRQAGLAWRE